MKTIDVEDLGVKKNGNNRIELNTGLSQEDRKIIVAGLSILLSDSYLLMLKTHLYHWNVRGPLFHTIHEMTEEQYTNLFEAIDVIAERIRALGFDSPGTTQDFIKLSSINDGFKEADQETIIKDMLQSHENVINTARRALPAAENAGDEVTIDLLTERLTVHEKAAWMWRSFLEKE